jgi:hypothetical protein
MASLEANTMRKELRPGCWLLRVDPVELVLFNAPEGDEPLSGH